MSESETVFEITLEVHIKSKNLSFLEYMNDIRFSEAEMVHPFRTKGGSVYIRGVKEIK